MLLSGDFHKFPYNILLTSFHSYQQCRRVPFSPHPLQHLLLADFCITDILIGVKWYLLLKTMGCFSGCLVSSAGIQKLFCGIYSAYKCSFDEFVGEKVVSPFYSSTILGPPPSLGFLKDKD